MSEPDAGSSGSEQDDTSSGSDAGLTYPTFPDGSPIPVLTVYDLETITLSGVVPSEDAVQWLETLALANSKFPEAGIENSLVVNPDVPISVGVRVVELNSVRFPAGSAEVLPEHAAELDRVAGILDLFENVSALVIGHADQRGSATANFEISEQRAQSVVAYLVAQGIDPSRLSSRAVGEEDLITLNDDDAAFALNRRTEFIFYGLLVADE
ncbi:MAG: OmpA family protein [Ilumatobacteraceae bacterium]